MVRTSTTYVIFISFLYLLEIHTIWTCKYSGFQSSTFVWSSFSLSATRQQKENISQMKKEGKEPLRPLWINSKVKA